MPKIKNIQDLINLKEESLKKVNIRHASHQKDRIILKIAMGTCGIAAGAKETYSALIEEIEKRELKNIVVVQTGCMGYCHAEPTVEVNEPNKEPILYGKITADKVVDLIEKHIIKGELLQDSIVGETHKRA